MKYKKQFKKQRFFVLLLLVLCFGLAACEKEKKEVSNAKELINNDYFSTEEKDKMGITEGTSIEIYSNPNLKQQYFVKVITEYNWSEALYRIIIKGDKKIIENITPNDIIDNVTLYSNSFGGNLKLPDKYIPLLISISSSSHMGNGNTIFYACKNDGTMDELLCAEGTVDQNKDSTNGIIFENGRLNIAIETHEDDNYSEIVFTGREYKYGVKGTDASGKYLYQIIDIKRVYSFDESTLLYKESSSNSEDIIQTMDGVISYEEYWQNGSK